MPGAFDPGFDDLPARLAVFPLTGALLLPRGRLPLNIFEPRYLAMTRFALAHGQAIGMIQPQEGAGDVGDPPLYRTGCMGRIIEFRETGDGRYLIVLKGIARFDVTAEPRREALFRMVVPDWRRYEGDLADTQPELARDRMMAAIKPYFARQHIEADLGAIANAPARRLINSLSMMLPFAARERQALLEAADATARGELLIALMEMGAVAGDEAGRA
jgi:hypothetical protein